MAGANLNSGTSDVVGHRKVIERLWNALGEHRSHHAYLFEGPAGVGKRLVAERYAMAANCSGTGLPCGGCPSCVKIAQWNHPDVILLEAEKSSSSRTISVGQVREVIRKLGYHRFSAKRRVVIVDPAEALTPTAANALLKTLEEPPEGTGFILISHQSDLLLPTILSRCQRVLMAPVGIDDLATWLAQKGVEAPEQVAEFAGGCPGKALALSGGELAERMALRDVLLRLVNGSLEELFEWSKSLCRGDRQVWSRKVEKLLEVTEELLRDVVVLSQDRSKNVLHKDVIGALESWQVALIPFGVDRCYRAVADARTNMERNVSGRLVVEAIVSTIRSELAS